MCDTPTEATVQAPGRPPEKHVTLQQFADKWTHPESPTEPVTDDALRATEEYFGMRLPEDYRQNVLQTGLPRPTIALLDAIVERSLSLADVSHFCSPAEMIEDTLDWRDINLPERFIVFARDCMGNMFCFDADRLRSNAPDAASIWYVDHDDGAAKQVAPSFDSWISAFCDVEPWPGTELG